MLTYETQSNDAARYAGRRRFGWQAVCRIAAILATLFLCAQVALFEAGSRRWPLVNDAALMHYVVFLMRAGMAPYREIADINLPGAYALEWLATVLGPPLHLSAAAMWRVTDATLLALAAAAMLWIAGRRNRFAGIFAGALFALYHGRDGIGQAGQRDLQIAALLLLAIALLLSAARQGEAPGQGRAALRAAVFGAAVGAAATIKPMEAVFLLCLLPLLLHQQEARRRWLLLAGSVAGFALPALATGGFLWHWGAFGAAAQVVRVDLPYHATLGRIGFWQLLRISSIASLWKLLLLAAAAAFAGSRFIGNRDETQRAGRSVAPDRAVLVLSTLLGLFSFLVQGKGYPYQRYPYVAFLLLLAALELTAAAASRRWLARSLGAGGLAFGVLLCAPGYQGAAARARWPLPVTGAMEQALEAQQAAAGSLDGAVQCLDVITGCTDALLHLHLREATGTLYDEFLFPQAQSGQAAGLPPAVVAARRRFQAELLARPPRVLILSAWLFPEGPGRYRELPLWPWLDGYLRQHYRLMLQRDFARAENGPMGFRMYVLDPAAFH